MKIAKNGPKLFLFSLAQVFFKLNSVAVLIFLHEVTVIEYFFVLWEL